MTRKAKGGGDDEVRRADLVPPPLATRNPVVASRGPRACASTLGYSEPCNCSLAITCVDCGAFRSLERAVRRTRRLCGYRRCRTCAVCPERLQRARVHARPASAPRAIHVQKVDYRYGVGGRRHRKAYLTCGGARVTGRRTLVSVKWR
eukprot:202503-Prorocentrum_minimum.AAC.6